MPHRAHINREDLIATIRQHGSRVDHALVYYRDGEKDLLSESLAHGASPDAIVRPRLGHSLLQEAALDGPADLFGSIVERSRNLDHRDRDGNTALHGALQSGSGEKALALIDAGAKTNGRNNFGMMPINSLAMVEDDESRARLAAAFVAAGCSLDHKARITGHAPLHDLAEIGDAESARVLIEGGAIARIRDDRKQRASEIARRAGHDEMASFLEGEEERERLHGKIPRSKPDRATAVEAAVAMKVRAAGQRQTAQRRLGKDIEI